MAASRYEKNVIRHPAVIGPDGSERIVRELDTTGKQDTGSITWFSRTFGPDAQSIIELTIISGDIFVGRGTEWPPKEHEGGDDATVGAGGVDWPAHRHDYEEMFLFQSTSPAGPLGEAEYDLTIYSVASMEMARTLRLNGPFTQNGLFYDTDVWFGPSTSRSARRRPALRQRWQSHSRKRGSRSPIRLRLSPTKDDDHA